MNLLSCLILFLVVSFSSCEELNEFGYGIEEDAHLTVPELIEKNGYPVEVHQVQTPDGYILEMHRIPYGLAEGSGPAADKPVVFLQHGIFLSSAAWVISGPQRGLGYLLADLGYDVWMGNTRGNIYSRKHINLSPNDSKFWDFSWHEMGVYDLPAMIDYTLEQTKQRQVFYIGHGQGTTVFYVMCSELPEYNNKIRAQFSLAPVAYMNHTTSAILKFLSLFEGPLEQLWNMIGENCANENPATQLVCTNPLFILSGYNKNQIDTDFLPVILGHTPEKASHRQILHYAQLVKTNKFRQYDYGSIQNMIKYKQISPPKYDLANVASPVALFYSHNDFVVSEVDVFNLATQLPNLVGRFAVSDDKFGHLDFLWGKDAVSLVYNKVFSLMTRL